MAVRARTGSGAAEQVCHDHRSADVRGSSQDERQCGIGVDAFGEVGMVGEADYIKTGVVGEAGMREYLMHLVDAGLQPETEKDFAVGHESIQSGTSGHLRCASCSYWRAHRPPALTVGLEPPEGDLGGCGLG